MHKYIGLLIMIVIFALIGTVVESTLSSQTPKVEHFGLPSDAQKIFASAKVAPPLPLATNDLTIHYTSDIYSCWFPGAYYIVDDPKYKTPDYAKNFSYDVAWYKKLLEYHQAKMGPYNPEDIDSKIIVGLKEVIAEYDKFPFGPGSCMITVPNWKSVRYDISDPSTADMVLYGNIEQNVHRTPINSWADILHDNPNIGLLEGPSISFRNKDGTLYDKVTQDGKQKVKATLQNFDAATAQKLYCSEVVDLDNSEIAYGFMVNPTTKEVRFVKNGKPLDAFDLAKITSYDILTYIEQMYPKESRKYDQQNNEILLKDPTPISRSITRITKNICGVGKKQKHENVKITVTFTESIDIKTISMNTFDNMFFLGTSDTIDTNIKNFQEGINKYDYWFQDKSNQQAQLNESIKSSTQALKQSNKQYDNSSTLVNQRLGRLRDVVQQYNRRQLTLTRFIQEIRDFQTKYPPAVTQQKTDKTDVLSKDTTLTKEKNMYDTNDKEIQKNIRLVEEAKMLLQRIKELRSYMSDEFIRKVTNMILFGKMTMIPDVKIETTSDNRSVIYPEQYWKYLSHDGNLYIEL